MDRLWMVGALLLSPAVAHATPPICPSVSHVQLPAAQDAMAWVGLMHELPPGTTFQDCPVDQNSKYLRGLLFSVSDQDCPNGCGAERPQTVEFLEPGTAATQTFIDAYKALPPRLARYCVYVPRPGTTAPPHFVAGEFAEAPEPSAMAITASGFTADLAAYHEALTNENVQYCDVFPTHTGPRLALLDTAETAPGSTGSDLANHGHVLARLIEELACAGGSCGFSLSTRSSMPLADVVPAPVWSVQDGGHFGSLEWLAQSIMREVVAWRLSGEPNLVLNLSLAWHEDWGGDAIRQGLGSCERTDVVAVYDALRFARCSGALLVASAGNRTGGGTDSGNMFPGAWADVAISSQDCLEDFEITGAPLSIGGSPLVFTVGGVSADGDPILLARPQGLPYLVAYADHVAVPGLAPITGNSVATALVSAEAARLWSQDAMLTADQVMDALWNRAVPTAVVPTGPYANLGGWFGGASVARQVASCIAPSPVAPPTWPPATLPQVSPEPPGPDPISTLAPTGGYLPFATPTPTTTTCPSCDLLVDARKFTYDISQFTPVGNVTLAFYTSSAPGAPVAQTFRLGQGSSGVVSVQSSLSPKRAALLFNGRKDGRLVGYLAEVKVSYGLP